MLGEPTPYFRNSRLILNVRKRRQLAHWLTLNSLGTIAKCPKNELEGVETVLFRLRACPFFNLGLVLLGSSRVGSGSETRLRGIHHALPDYRSRSIGLRHTDHGFYRRKLSSPARSSLRAGHASGKQRERSRRSRSHRGTGKCNSLPSVHRGSWMGKWAPQLPQ